MNTHKRFIGCSFLGEPLLDSGAEQRNGIIHNYTRAINKQFDTISNDKFESNDLRFILVSLYVNPPESLAPHIKDIEKYDSGDRSIGMSIIINNDFFNKEESERLKYLRDMILNRLNQLSLSIAKKRFDIDMSQLINDVESALNLDSLSIVVRPKQQLAIEFSMQPENPEEITRWQQLEVDLTELLEHEPDTSVDGNDVGKDYYTIYILTSDPERALKKTQRFLQDNGSISYNYNIRELG